MHTIESAGMVVLVHGDIDYAHLTVSHLPQDALHRFFEGFVELELAIVPKDELRCREKIPGAHRDDGCHREESGVPTSIA